MFLGLPLFLSVAWAGRRQTLRAPCWFEFFESQNVSDYVSLVLHIILDLNFEVFLYPSLVNMRTLYPQSIQCVKKLDPTFAKGLTKTCQT